MVYITSYLYKVFIPIQHKPIRVQAENALYHENISKSATCTHKKRFWNFRNQCDCSDDSVSAYSNLGLTRRCSFGTVCDEESSDDLEKSVVENTYDDDTNVEYISGIDYFIQFCVKVTGSVYTFIIVWIIIIVWIVLGIIYKAPNNWQIIMQDGQSIQTYIWNMFLMRQQLDDTQKFLKVYGKLRSRLALLKKLVGQVKEQKGKGKFVNFDVIYEEPDKGIVLDKLTIFEELSNLMAKLIGSLPSVIIYWIGIFIWIGCGALYSPSGNTPPFTGKYTGDNPQFGKFTDQWQMYINTAVALELLITSSFLENLRLRSNNETRNQFEKLVRLDSELELKLRRLTGYTGDNQCIIVKPMERRGLQKVISFYAGVVGNGLGLVITVCVFAAWIGIGGVLKWNDNWWLIIGTYTGLMGFIDSVVLREVYYSLTNYEEKMIDVIVDGSQDILSIIGSDYDIKTGDKVETDRFTNFGLKISEKVNYVCSTKYTVVTAVCVVIGLVAMGCALRWSQTAQLVANTPTMIIEGFFLLILIQAHDSSDFKKKDIMSRLTKSRQILANYIM